MRQETIALLLDETGLTLEELATSCMVSREWIIEHVTAGVLLSEAATDPAQWAFTGQDLLRARRLIRVEKDFDANPELAGLVVDLLDELERMRMRLRRAGLALD